MKSLEALKRMYNRNHHYNNLDEKVQDDNDYDTIVKELKALEIIKEKGVNVGNFKDMLEDWKDITFKNYLSYRVENGYELQNDYYFILKPLNEEEYDLLKEVLL